MKCYDVVTLQIGVGVAMARWAPARFDLNYCIQRRTFEACTSRQMRSVFFALNMVAWLLIILAIDVLA
jgi:hypothetical protein